MISEGKNPLVSYIYDGAGSPMQTSYNEPNLSLTYANGGLDRFGRVVNHSWMNGTDPLVHIIHSYDCAGNRTFRHDAVHAANSELYAYDQLNQIKALDRGVLNQDRTAVTTPNHAEAWNFDKTGNWDSYNKNGVTETRTHNAANEIQGITMHDANGNMTLMPGLKGKYDAWNRLVEVRDEQNNLLGEYAYNGVNQRIKKTIGATVTKSFFNEKWQELESTTGSELTEYVWGLRYVDDLVLREKGEERLYSLADPNWNVVALTDTAGSAVEHMKYDAFGKISWLDDNFDTKTGSDFAWNRTFTGQVLDNETGLMLYRNRYYHTGVGRFVSRDPIGYEAEDVNVYRYLNNCSLSFTDPLGLFKPDHMMPWQPDNPLNKPEPLPPFPPTPTGAGCPKGWKMVQDTHPVANGCGPAGNGIFQGVVRILTTIGQKIGGADFTQSCNSHDLCWGDCSANRKNCDDQFLKNMREACNKKYPGKKFYLERQWCLTAARNFHAAVSGSSGNSSFDNARANHCKCVCDK